jgi:hypothetical protein
MRRTASTGTPWRSTKCSTVLPLMRYMPDRRVPIHRTPDESTKRKRANSSGVTETCRTWRPPAPSLSSEPSRRVQRAPLGSVNSDWISGPAGLIAPSRATSAAGVSPS